MTFEYLSSFLGWCSVINIAIFAFSSIMLMVMNKPISKLHSKRFGLDENDLSLIYFRYLGNYKLAIIIFNIVPYVALKLM